jgi:hypothetical protein
MIVEDGR